jgi:glutaredoxin 3
MTKITVYTTSFCPYCHMETEYLKQKRIVFEEVRIDQDPRGEQKLIDTCGSMVVPCTHIAREDGSEERVLGFDLSGINEALNIG